MKYVLVIALFILGTQTLQAQEAGEFDLSKDDISEKWFAGSSLVYDCLDMHWVCVSPADYTTCKDLREIDFKRKKHRLACVPGEVYETKKECNRALKMLVSRASFPRVCVHPEERPRFIGFR
jgi:hypothetical protein